MLADLEDILTPTSLSSVIKSGEISLISSTLAVAIIRKDTAAMKLLLDNNADPLLPVHGDKTPLDHAVNLDDEAVNVALRPYCGEILSVWDEKIRLHRAKGQEIPEGFSPLQVALLAGNQKVVERVIESGADVNAHKEGTDAPLSMAINSGFIISALRIIGKKPLLDIPSINGAFPLHLAAFRKMTPVVEALLNAGADPLVRFEGETTALHLASSKGHEEIVSLLAAKTPLDVRDATLSTPLHSATNKGHAHVVQLLLRAGADANACDRTGNTALHIACTNGDNKSAQALIAGGAQLDLLGSEGLTPQALAEKSGNQQILELFGNLNKPSQPAQKAPQKHFVESMRPAVSTQVVVGHPADNNVGNHKKDNCCIL